MKKYGGFICMAIALLLASGCSQTQPDGTGALAASAPKAVSIQDFAGRSIDFPSVPRKIAVLSNGDMDIIYALGGEVVGRPTSNGPVPIKDAAQAEQIGTTHGIDLEKIAYLSPDVVLGNYPMNTKDIPSVEGIGSKIMLTSANSISDIQKQIQLFGQLLQKESKANELILAIDQKVKEINPEENTVKPRVLLVYGAPGTYMAALNNSLSGDILVKAGGENIAADYPKLENYPQYAQLNTEKIIQSNPQLILLMSHGNPEQVKDGFLKEMQQNAAWHSLDAVKENRVDVLPADLFGTNPGTRVIEALDLLHKRLQDVK
ncbi:ABC transporter substrate-binding protein [Paenibacillus naphthalenovorans]|uniref:ABC transporter substrate-binding protein n=1 Tax=Paenibacillus naphthalenovorans TaxID=162209 RepID=UPI000890ABA8|nr:ABC transporter substrate-binding protein [Paenibacillus naphthalenovorans]SDI01143.1 iron complex transport system substrate-binding protein [Paenibacillus naphthalenovorans]